MDRQYGYYFVKTTVASGGEIREEWFVARWGGAWFSDMCHDVQDEHWLEIDETRIMSPAEIASISALAGGCLPTSPKDIPDEVVSFVDTHDAIFDIFQCYIRGYE